VGRTARPTEQLRRGAREQEWPPSCEIAGWREGMQGGRGAGGANNLCIYKKLERTASLEEREREASGACDLFGQQSPASSDYRCADIR
jgi:hypothetical protein